MSTPISDGAQAFMGPLGVQLMSGAAVLAFISTANAGILAAQELAGIASFYEHVGQPQLAAEVLAGARVRHLADDRENVV